MINSEQHNETFVLLLLIKGVVYHELRYAVCYSATNGACHEERNRSASTANLLMTHLLLTSFKANVVVHIIR
jgi:hypothetical protein